MRMSSLEDANKTPKKHRFQYIRDSVFLFSFSVNALKTAFFFFFRSVSSSLYSNEDFLEKNSMFI